MCRGFAIVEHPGPQWSACNIPVLHGQYDIGGNKFNLWICSLICNIIKLYCYSYIVVQHQFISGLLCNCQHVNTPQQLEISESFSCIRQSEMKQGQNISQLYPCRSQPLIVCEGITSCVNAITGKKYPIVHATYHNFEMHFQGLLHRYCGVWYLGIYLMGYNPWLILVK